MASSSRQAIRAGLTELVRTRSASTSASTQEWTGWLRTAASDLSGRSGTALLLAGLVCLDVSFAVISVLTQQGTYPHVPKNPSKASLDVWAQASEALLKPDTRMGYTAEGLSEKEWKEGLRGWVAGRTLVSYIDRDVQKLTVAGRVDAEARCNGGFHPDVDYRYPCFCPGQWKHLWT